MTDLSPLVFFVKTLFLVSLKIGRVENEAILHTYIKNTYSTKTTYKNKEMYFIYELSPLYKKSLTSQFTWPVERVIWRNALTKYKWRGLLCREWIPKCVALSMGHREIGYFPHHVLPVFCLRCRVRQLIVYFGSLRSTLAEGAVHPHPRRSTHWFVHLRRCRIRHFTSLVAPAGVDVIAFTATNAREASLRTNGREKLPY